jgi:hypothetical protein
MWVSSDKRLMGDYVNGKAAKFLGWATAALMGAAVIALFATGVSVSDDAASHGWRQAGSIDDVDDSLQCAQRLPGSRVASGLGQLKSP